MNVHGNLAAMKYAIDKLSGMAIYIDKVLNGLKCHCYCPECGKNVLAIQGEKNDWHFRHEVESSCHGGQESAIHKLVIQMVKENTVIKLPHGILNYTYRIFENPIKPYIPDVIITADGEPVFVEVKFTHGSTYEKIKFYQAGEHKSFEIMIPSCASQMSPDDIKTWLFESGQYIQMIYWPEIVEIEEAKIIGPISEHKSVGILPVDNSSSWWQALLFILTFILVGRWLLNFADRKMKRI